MSDEQLTMFERKEAQPLAARMRPQTIDEIVGQQHLLGEGKVLRRIIERDAVTSMIFWGPPGVGKTTLAGVIAHHTKAKFINFSAVTSGIREIRAVMKEAEENRRFMRKNGIVLYLSAPAEVLASRLQANPNAAQRPTLTGKSIAEEVAEVLAAREPLYRETATHILNAAATPKELLAEALAILKP